MSAYFGAIDPTRERFPTTPAHSVPGTPNLHSPAQSRPASVRHEDIETDITETTDTPLEQTPTMDSSVSPSETVQDSPPQPGSIRNARRRNVGTRHPRFSEPESPSTHNEHIHQRQYHRHKHVMSHGPLLPIVKGSSQPQAAVGVYESIRYTDLEEKFSHPNAAHYTERFHQMLRGSCDDMLGVTDETLVALDGWLNTVTSKSRFKFWRHKGEHQKAEKERVDGYVQLKEKLDRTLEVFEKEKRCVCGRRSVIL